jgi:hypothetical protein
MKFFPFIGILILFISCAETKQEKATIEEDSSPCLANFLGQRIGNTDSRFRLNQINDTLVQIMISNQVGHLNSEAYLKHWTERSISELSNECIKNDQEYAIEFVFEIDPNRSLKYKFNRYNVNWLKINLKDSYLQSVDHVIENDQVIELIVCDSLLDAIDEHPNLRTDGILGVVKELPNDSIHENVPSILLKAVSFYSYSFCKTSGPFDLINSFLEINGMEPYEEVFWEKYSGKKPSWKVPPEWVQQDTTANNV